MECAVEDRQLVIPGQLVGKNIRCDFTCYMENGNIYSAVEGLARTSKDRMQVIPSRGMYMPKEGDLVIGVVEEVLGTVWMVDTGCPYKAFILKDEVIKTRTENVDMRKYFNVGDVLSGKVSGLNEVHSHLLIRPWKLGRGMIIKVNPKRVPRIVGKKRSMLEIIKNKTGTRLIVGQNGRIWLSDGNINLAVKAIKKIEREAQTRGLTDRISLMLDKESKSKKEA